MLGVLSVGDTMALLENAGTVAYVNGGAIYQPRSSWTRRLSGLRFRTRLDFCRSVTHDSCGCPHLDGKSAYRTSGRYPHIPALSVRFLTFGVVTPILPFAKRAASSKVLKV
jgi:hypothetical protein